MTDRRLQSLFHAALALPPDHRADFIERVAGDDLELRRELSELLELDGELGERTLRPLTPDLTRLLASGALPAPGVRVGPYELRDLIGSGGMGRVFRAERVDGVMARSVAIKFVHRDLLDDDLLRRFRLERQLLASLDHPNIARLFDADETPEGTPYVVMELVDGEPITAYCERRRLGLRERIALVRQVCGAVAEAHRQLVVHRDLKPGNLLVTAGGVPKLLDFGIAKPLATAFASESTRTAERFFSPLYAAPEQLSGTATGVACDIYGLGLLLYELLAGRRPFDFRGLSAAEVERLVLDTPPPPPSVATAGTSTGIAASLLRGELDDIVLRCLRKAPAERYPSAEQLEADLGNYLAGRPVAARGSHRWYRLRKFVGRHRGVVTLAAITVAVLVTASALLLSQNLQLTRERDRSRYAMRLLSDAFTSADPGHAANGTVSARLVLDAATPRIEETFDSRPDIYADLARSVAEIQFNLGLWPQSAALAGRAADAARRAGLPPSEIGRLRILQAMALVDAGQVHEADQLLGEGGDAQSALPEWRLARGHILVNQNRPEQAIPILRAALAEVADRPASDDTATQLRWELAAAQRAGEHDPEALATLDDTLAWQRASLPESNSRVLLTRQRRIVALRDNHDKQTALAESQAVLDRIVADYGAQGAFAADARMNLGRGLNDAGRYDEAAGQFRQAHEAYRLTLGEHHARAVRCALNLAEVLSQVDGKAAESESWYRRALDDGAAGLGETSTTVAFFRLRYANFLLGRRRAADALAVVSSAAELASLPGLPDAPRGAHAAMIRRALDLACGATERTGPACAAGEKTLAAAATPSP